MTPQHTNPALIHTVTRQSNPVEAARYLLDLLMSGKLLETLKTEPMEVIAAVFVVITALISRIRDDGSGESGPGTPLVFALDADKAAFDDLCIALLTQLQPGQYAGIGTAIMWKLLISALLKALEEWLSQD